jgi:hypothetical protein
MISSASAVAGRILQLHSAKTTTTNISAGLLAVALAHSCEVQEFHVE